MSERDREALQQMAADWHRDNERLNVYRVALERIAADAAESPMEDMLGAGQIARKALRTAKAAPKDDSHTVEGVAR